MGSPGCRPPLPNARTPVPILHSFPGRARRQGARGSFRDSCRPRVRMRDSKLDPLSKAGNATGCSGRGRSALPQLSLDVFPGGVFDIPRGQARGSDGEAILVRRPLGQRDPPRSPAPLPWRRSAAPSGLSRSSRAWRVRSRGSTASVAAGGRQRATKTSTRRLVRRL